MYDLIVKTLISSWLVLGQMGPYLLFGFLIAGVLSVCISPEWVERHLGRGGVKPIFKAALFGIPLPLCSCSVIPVSASIRRHGASRAATTAFLLSTPQTGVDSIAVTYALLGPVFAIFRPVAALFTGLIGGGLVQLTEESEDQDESQAEPEKCTECCCAHKEHRSVWRRVLSYGFVTLPADIGLALLVGCLVAGAIAAFVEPDQLHAYIGGGIGSILLMMAAGIPIYVCATASVPIAVGLIHAGASPGAALAFLIAGPATNAATLTTIWKLLGKRATAGYLATVAVGTVLCGLALDWLTTTVGTGLPELVGHDHKMEAVSAATHFWAIALLAVVGYSIFASRQKHNHEH